AGMIEEDLLLFLFSRDTSPKPFAMRNPDYSMDSNSILQLHFSCAYPVIAYPIIINKTAFL
ncbi:MAG: hypothetical protein AAGF83_11295, partial [Cyanobacteria bacterium P01_G01_bin.67]